MKKILMIIGGIVLGLVILGSSIIFIVSLTSDKMICKSDVGNLKVMYRDDKIKGYTATGHITFNKEEAQHYVDLYGMEEYLTVLNEWFVATTNGSCKR